jgi:demethylmacrocin O-methyltransferase
MSLATNDTLRRVLSPAQRAALRRGDDAVRGLWRRQHALHRTMAYPLRGNLDLLARVYGTDKSSRLHNYTRHYAEHLKPIRHEVRSVLEIGIGGLSSRHGYDTEAGGMSLRMWQDFFPNARIVGMDIERKVVTGERISVEQGSQDDPVFLADLAARYGPFDIVIDDGSHIGRHVRASLDALFDHVKPGGFYVIEDLAMAYVKDWEGGPPGTPGTQTELIKPLVDDVLRRHWDEFGSARPMAALHLYDQILFIQKAR